MSAFARRWPDMVTAALGLAGLACAGPLAATLLVGRSALILPSARWLLVAGLWWVLLSAFALAVLGRDRAWQAWLFEACLGLAPTCAVVPLLVALYASDAAFQAAVGGATPPSRALVLYLALLAVGGVVVRRAAGGQRDISASPPRIDGDGDSGVLPKPEVPLYVVAPLAAIGIMALLNAGVFGALQRRAPLDVQAIALLTLQLAMLAAAAAVASRSARGGWALAACFFIAWLLFAPLQESLAIDWRPQAALLLASLALWRLSRSGYAAGAALLGLVAALVPAAAATVLVFAALRRRRAALVNAAVAAVAIEADLAVERGMAGAPGLAFSASPHAANAALGGFFSRLFVGPGALTAQSSDAHQIPALALALGTLFVGGWLLWQCIYRSSAISDASTSVALGLAAGLLFAGTTPRADLALAAMCLVPLASPRLWPALRIRERTSLAVLATSGYLLAGTSVEALLRAGAEPITAWPPLASLPALGLTLLCAALLIAVRASSLSVTELSAAASPRPAAPIAIPDAAPP